MLCINGMIYVGQSLEGVTFKTPFNTNNNVTAVTMPNIVSANNQTGVISGNSLLVNTTSSVRNQTNNNILNPIQNNIFYILNILYIIVSFIGGGFIWSSLTPFGFPPVFVYVLETVIGLLVVRNVVYVTTGR